MFWRKGRTARENRRLISASMFPVNRVYECHPEFGSIGNAGERKTISIFRIFREKNAMRCWQSGRN